MFDFMFGWRKASRCKKLMKKLRCRLNLLKNKRCCIVRQLRNDVVQLIKHGHHQTAFNRVDQIYKDECIIAVYDLLAHFCEFLCLQLSYIRRTKDCPNDINEAISSLIFASARCGELPELIRIRKLFRARYGENFEARALDLLPGNLVNFQIRENLSINYKVVPNQVKSKLLEEITSVLQTGPLALEYTSKQGQLQVTNYDTLYDQIAEFDFTPSQSDFDHQALSITYPVEAESSLENEINDIEEFQSPFKDGRENEKDQRVFMFTSSTLFPGGGNHKRINLLISIIEKLAYTMRMKRQSRTRPVSSDIECSHPQRTMVPQGQESSMLVKPIGEPRICSRAMTMPCDSWKRCVDKDVVMRSYSFPVQQGSPHVHPKLPDYDELAAKFMALKKEKIQNQEISSI